MYSLQQREEMARIFNEIISKTEFSGVVNEAVADDFSEICKQQLIWWASQNGLINGRNKLIPIFSSIATNRKRDTGQFFHFKANIDIIKSILQDRKVQLTALKYHGENDHAEYSEFFKRSEYFDHFCDGNIQELKRKIFILCLTKNFREKLFWENYAKKGTGACIVFRFEYKGDKQACYELRDIGYDSGYRFDFISELRHKFLNEFDKELFIDGITKFAQFYKRDKYRWENESRLSFNFNIDSYKNCLESSFEIKSQKDDEGNIKREFIELNFDDNPFFNLVIDEVICGANMDDTVFENIKSLMPNIDVWKLQP